MSQPSQSRPLRGLYRLLMGLTLLVYLFALWYTWHLNLNDTRANLLHVNSMLAQGARTTLKSHELSLRGIGEELLARGALQQPERGRALIERMRSIDPGMVGFGLARGDGQMVLVSGIAAGTPLQNLASREETRATFWETLVAGRLRTGRPYHYRELGEWVVPIRVPLRDAGGKVKAMMNAGYQLEGGTTSWANMNLPPNVQVALIGDDGYLRYRYPLPGKISESALKTLFDQPIPDSTRRWLQSLGDDATFASRAMPSAGGHHFLAHSHIAEYGLHTLVLTRRSAVIHAWLQRMLLPTALMLIFVVGGTFAYRRAEAQQARSESAVKQLGAWQQAVLDGAEYAIISTDTEGTIVSFNRAAQRMLGYRDDEVRGKARLKSIHDHDEATLRAAELGHQLGRHIDDEFEVFVAMARRTACESREWTYLRKDGSRVPVHVSVSALRDNDDEIIGFMAIATDLSERQAMRAHLRDSEARYSILFERAGDAIFLMRDERFIDCNPVTLEMFGCSREQIIGAHPSKFSPQLQPDGTPSEQLARQYIQSAMQGHPQRFEWTHLRHDGTPFDADVSLTAVEIGTIQHLLATVRDITDRKNAERDLAHQARHDSLTGLPNRVSLHHQVHDFIHRAHSSSEGALLLLDLDRFKEINDTLGHHAGDDVLKQIGPRLQNTCAGRCAVIARLGGDEFAIFTDRGGSESMQLAQAMVEAMQQPFRISGMEVRLGASVGIAQYPQHGEDSHALLRAADVAMYRAKRLSLGVNRYEAQYDGYSTERLALANELNEALQNNELVLHYQPKIDISSGRTVGFEALVRWQHPRRGLLYPDTFIDLVEMSEIVHPFTQEIISLAVTDMQRLRSLGLAQPVAINLSARNLQDSRCYTALAAALDVYEVPAKLLELELTETALMVDPDNAALLLQRFNERGVNIAVDDFGTGYSSLGYLRRLPLRALKIDRSFVHDMRNNEADAAIVRSTVALAHSLDLKVVAEGVENPQTLALLREMGCDQAQGYGVCRPQPLDAIIDWLQQAKAG